jgi:acetolactate synthase-1/2/3 large subunit
MRPWPAILDGLEAEEVEYIFGLPGSPELLYNDLYDHPRIRPVLVRHETSAVFMAMAYARVSGKVGVVHASPGPGMANLLPGLLEAYYACSPVVSLVSAAGRTNEGMGAFQETPSLDLARPVSKWAVRLDLADRATWTLERAFSLALNGKPGPVYVEIPGDVAGTDDEIPPYRPPLRDLRPAGSPELVARAAELLAGSTSPVIVAGGGVGLSGAERALVELAERLDAPVLTTPSGRGSIAEGHRLAFGLVGLYRTESSARPLDEADTVVLVGTRMEEFQSGRWLYFPARARVVQIDIDPFEIGRNIRPDVGLVGDARLVLGQLAERASPSGARSERTAELAAFREEFERQVDEECAPTGEELKTKQVVHALNRVFPEGFVLVNENGGQDLWSYYCPYLKVTLERGCVAPAEQTCMGFGVAGAIGAKLGRPDRHVVCVTGDGAFQMFAKEIPTAVQYGAPVLWIVLNNRGLGWTRWIQRATGEKYVASEFEAQPDLVALAQAYGAQAEQLSAPADVDAALGRARAALEAGRPAVLDCVIDTWDYPRGFVDYHREVRGLTLP